MATGRIARMGRLAKNGGWSAAPVDAALIERGAAIDQAALRAYRLEQVRAELRARDYAGAVLSDPMNIRYATGARNMAVWTMHGPGRYAFVATDGPVVLFDFGSSMHNSDGIDTIDERRFSTPGFYFLSGPRTEEKAAVWAEEIASMVHHHGGGNRRLAVDRCEPAGTVRLLNAGI